MEDMHTMEGDLASCGTVAQGPCVVEGGVLRVPVSLRFSGAANVKARQIGEALIALDSAMRAAAPVFAKSANVKPGGQAKPYCAISVDELRRGSLSERLLVDVFLGGDEQAHQFVENIIANCQSGSPMVVGAVVGALVVALVTGGAIWAIRKYSRAKKDSAMITAHNSVVVYAAGKLKIAESAFREMLRPVTERPAFARNSVKALRPGLDAEDGGLTVVSGDGRFRVPPAAFSELPTDEELEAAETGKEQPLRDVELTILASDIQRNRQGWAARLPEDHPYAGVRIRLEIAAGISLQDLMYRKKVVCDGVLHLAVNQDSGTFRPVKIVVNAVKGPSGSSAS